MRKILMIDDDKLSTHITSAKLQKKDFLVTIYNDPSEVMNNIHLVNEFDIILLDIMMPNITGIELLKEIRKSYGQSTLPIIMVTAQNSTEEIVEALSEGANDYINKPINFDILHSRITTQVKVLDLHKKEIENKQTQLFHAIIATYNHEINNQLNISLNATNKIKKELNNSAVERLEKSIEKISKIILKIEQLNPTFDNSMKEYLNKANMLDLDDNGSN